MRSFTLRSSSGSLPLCSNILTDLYGVASVTGAGAWQLKVQCRQFRDHMMRCRQVFYRRVQRPRDAAGGTIKVFAPREEIVFFRLSEYLATLLRDKLPLTIAPL